MTYPYRDPVDRRYQEDNDFHMLVDMLHSFIIKYQFSPSELREAVMYAATKYEMTNMRPYILSNERNVSIDELTAALKRGF